MTVYGFVRGRRLKGLHRKRSRLMNFFDLGKTIDTADRIAFCPLEEASVCDSKSFKDLLEVLREGDAVWCLSMIHVSKDIGDVIEFAELIAKKGANVIFCNNGIICKPEHLGGLKQWLLQLEEGNFKKIEAKEKQRRE